MIHSQIIKNLIAAIALSALATLPLQATILYSGTFQGSSADPLDGEAPEVAPSAETWTALNSLSGIRADGSWNSGVNNSDDANAFLPFSPAAGTEYTLTVTLNQPTGSWVGFGFAQTNSVSDDFWANITEAGTPWLLYRQSGNGQVVSFSGAGTAGSADEGNLNGTQTFSIVLNTMGASWTAEWFNGATSLRTESFTPPSIAISYVGFGRDGVSAGSIESFQLSVVPEPSTYALILGTLAMGMIILHRRRNHK